MSKETAANRTALLGEDNRHWVQRGHYITRLLSKDVIVCNGYMLSYCLIIYLSHLGDILPEHIPPY